MSQVQCLPTGIDRIDADRSTTKAGDGRGTVGVNVAVIDSGIDASHPDLNVVGGVSCVNDKLGPSVDPFGHGTEVAGVLAAADNNLGVVGVAPGARLWSARVVNRDGRSSISDMVCGIDWVTSTRKDVDPGNDIAVANMSLGFMTRQQPADDGNCGRTNRDALHLAICNSVAAGTTYVVAGGNSGIDFQSFAPASYDEVLTATAMVDFDGRPGGLVTSLEGTCVSPQNRPFVTDDGAAFFSNYATLSADQAHAFAAPGGCILTTASPGSAETPGPDRYVSDFSGTSASVPHVAGTVALCIASGPCAGLTPAEIIGKIGADSRTYSAQHPSYGFDGDPLHPISGKYYGYLIRAGLY
jgi:subtilisin family serine protease